MEVQLQQAVDQFCTELGNHPRVIDFKRAKDDFFNDAELKALRTRYNELLLAARKKQYDGTLTQEEIDSVRSLQAQVSKHPITQRYVETREEVLSVLNDCNREISELLGFNYAQVAAPPVNCG